MSSPLSVRFLRDVAHGGSSGQLADTADALAAFVTAATVSLDIAIYDFRLDDAHAVSAVVGALTAAADRGVVVRIGYDAGKPASAADFAAVGGDPAPVGTAEWVSEHFAGTTVQIKAIKAGSQLMHSKYVIRDAPVIAAAAEGRHRHPHPHPATTTAVWTGSTNFTDDAWTLQENNVITVADTDVAAAYRKDFDQMWAAGAIAGAGAGDAGTTALGSSSLGWDFCPGDGAAVDAALVARITAATERLVLASMVVTSHDVLAALADAVHRGVAISGIYDGGQMDPIVAQWGKVPADAQVIADWKTVSTHLAVKHSVPYSPTSPHNFMHLKVLISDGVLTTGSYNFSANAEKNAENQIHLSDPTTVAAYATYLAAVITAYS